jgi:ArsR family transcriptional regulator, cadmium/lead-responsive transcriptional repressor
MSNSASKPTDLSESDEVLMTFFKVLGNPTRIRIVRALLEKERTVSELAKLLNMPQGSVSRDLASIKLSGYVKARREWTTIHYQITDERLKEIVSLAREIIADHAENLYTRTRIKR